MAKPKSYPYVVYYKDQTYQTIMLTKKDFEEVCNAIEQSRPVKITIGIMQTFDIRSVLERIDPPMAESQEELKSELPPTMTMEEMAYYYENLQAERERQNRRKDVDYQ